MYEIESSRPGEADLIVAKNRNGARGKTQECIMRPSVMLLIPKGAADNFERRTPEPAPAPGPASRPASSSRRARTVVWMTSPARRTTT